MTRSGSSTDDGTQVRLILSTVGSEEDAVRLSRLWVESHRAACVTRIGNARSVYSWQGAIQEEQEILLLIKTSVRSKDELAVLLESLAADHPYEEPELLVFEADGGAKGYLEWILSWRNLAEDPSGDSAEGGA